MSFFLLRGCPPRPQPLPLPLRLLLLDGHTRMRDCRRTQSYNGRTLEIQSRGTSQSRAEIMLRRSEERGPPDPEATRRLSTGRGETLSQTSAQCALRHQQHESLRSAGLACSWQRKTWKSSKSHSLGARLRFPTLTPRRVAWLRPRKDSKKSLVWGQAYGYEELQALSTPHESSTTLQPLKEICNPRHP